MLTTSKNVLIPGHNHRPTTGTKDPTLIIAQALASVTPLNFKPMIAGSWTEL